MNVIRYDSAEAVTTDGIHWEIYVSNEELLKGLDSDRYIQTSDIRYGSWSLETGLKRGPIFPSDDFSRMEKIGAVVYENLLCVHDQLPFPFSDTCEFWLLDQDNMPLALLDSTTNINEIDTEQPLVWRAGNLCNQIFFPDIPLKTSPAQAITEYINRLAGKAASAQWFARESDGSGMGLASTNLSIDDERILGVRYFPKYFINTHNHTGTNRDLINAYIDWQAPWLLLLHNLSDEDRSTLEQSARKQALLVDSFFRLYPTVIDSAAINAARVEAMMRRSQAEEIREETIMPPWYLELGEYERGK